MRAWVRAEERAALPSGQLRNLYVSSLLFRYTSSRPIGVNCDGQARFRMRALIPPRLRPYLCERRASDACASVRPKFANIPQCFATLAGGPAGIVGGVAVLAATRPGLARCCRGSPRSGGGSVCGGRCIVPRGPGAAKTRLAVSTQANQGG